MLRVCGNRWRVSPLLRPFDPGVQVREREACCSCGSCNLELSVAPSHSVSAISSPFLGIGLVTTTPSTLEDIATFCTQCASVTPQVDVDVAMSGSAASFPALDGFFEAQRPHYASQAEASPRVDSQFSGGKAARSFHVQNSCTEGDQTKGVSLSLT